MKINHTIVHILLIGSITIYPMSNISRPYMLQTKYVPALTGFFNSLYAQAHVTSGKFPIKAVVEGYIFHAPFWDTRQIFSIADGLVLFAPRPKKIGTDGGDINSVGNFNMSMVETMGRLKLFGPKIINAELFGLIECDFIGFDLANNMLRNRLAYLKLTWKEKRAMLLAGQYYHPLRLAHIDLDPKLISKNIGTPIHPNSQNPQLRFSKAWKNKLNIMLTGIAEMNFSSVSGGPDGFSSIYLRRSKIPIINFQFWYGPEDARYACGIGFDYKRLIPQLVTQKCVKTNAAINSFAFDAYAKMTIDPLSIRTQLIWAQNGTDYRLLGGYAVHSINPETGERTYTNISVLNYWLDLNVDKKISPGLFGGITKNLGAHRSIILSTTDPCTGLPESLVYGGTDIKYMARIVPRVRVHVKPMVFAAELEWTRAGYGTLTRCGAIGNAEPVNNVRIILASFFYF